MNRIDDHPEFLQTVPYDVQFVLRESRAGVEKLLKRYVRVFEGYEDHATSAARQHEERKRLERTPPLGHALVHADFMENPSVPLGPEEPGSWWFAIGRRKCTCLGIHLVTHTADSTVEGPRTLCL